MDSASSVLDKNQNTKVSYESYDHKKFNVIKPHMNHTIRPQTEVDYMVNHWIDELKAPGYRPLFRKAAWYLSEHTLQVVRERSRLARCEAAYFVGGLKRELAKMGRTT